MALATVQNARAALCTRERQRVRAREVAMRRWDELQRGEVGHEEPRRARMGVVKAMAHVLAARRGGAGREGPSRGHPPEEGGGVEVGGRRGHGCFH